MVACDHMWSLTTASQLTMHPNRTQGIRIGTSICRNYLIEIICMPWPSLGQLMKHILPIKFTRMISLVRLRYTCSPKWYAHEVPITVLVRGAGSCNDMRIISKCDASFWYAIEIVCTPVGQYHAWLRADILPSSLPTPPPPFLLPLTSPPFPLPWIKYIEYLKFHHIYSNNYTSIIHSF